MDLQINDIVMIVNVKNKRVAYIEGISCAYRGTFSTSSFNISKNLEVTNCNNLNKEEYKISKVWRFNKEKDNLIIIYPEHEKEEPVNMEPVYDEEKIKECEAVFQENHYLSKNNTDLYVLNSRLRDVVVEQALEINRLRRENNHEN